MYTTCGKQVLRNGENFAQAVDPGAATLIVDVLNGRRQMAKSVVRTLDGIDWQGGGVISAPCAAYQASDQMLCPCGLQWDVNDPDPPKCRRA